jgi:hypothetical protein
MMTKCHRNKDSGAFDTGPWRTHVVVADMNRRRLLHSGIGAVHVPRNREKTMKSSQISSLSSSHRLVSSSGVLALAFAGLIGLGGTALANPATGEAAAAKPQTTIVVAADNQAYADAMTAAFGWVDVSPATGVKFELADHTKSVASATTTAFGWVDVSSPTGADVVPSVDNAAIAAAATAAFGWVDIR